MDEPAVPRDVQLPGQELEADDLDPVIEPEPAAEPTGGTPALSADEPGGGDSNPELGNTLIAPDNS